MRVKISLFFESIDFDSIIADTRSNYTIFSKNKIARRVPVSVTIRSEKKTKIKTHSASSLHRLGHDLKCFFVVCVCVKREA